MGALSIRPSRAGDAELCERILRALPEWFGIESALLQYVRDAERLPTWIAEIDGQPVGFITLHQHFPEAGEIHCIALLPERHRAGAGGEMVRFAEAWLKQRGARLMQVKTLGPSRGCEAYERTRRFYVRMGFMPLEEIHGLWPGNPCLVLVKPL